MKRYFLIFTASVIVLTGYIQVQAGPTFYSDEASYNADTGSELFFIDFDEEPTSTDGDYFSDKVAFSALPDSPGEVYWKDDYIHAPSLMEAKFTDTVYAFAINYSDPAMSYYVSLYDIDGNLAGTFDPLSLGPSDASLFFGLLSDVDVPIKRIEILNIYGSNVCIDDFRVNEGSTKVIPAPGAIMLSSIGIGFVSFLRKRKAI